MDIKTTTCVAFFRGINVGGKNSMPMKELVQMLQSLGFENVKSYIQSGNVVMNILAQDGKDKDQNAASHIEKISSAVFKKFGFKPYVVLLNRDELLNAAKNNPFDVSNPKAVHFYFMNTKPQSPDLVKLEGLKTGQEDFKLAGKVFYLFAPGGIGRSKLAAKAEQALGIPATARNFNTVEQMIKLCNEAFTGPSAGPKKA